MLELFIVVACALALALRGHQDVRPQPRGHPVETFEFQRAKLRGLGDCRLTKRGEFRLDVPMDRVDIDMEFLGDLAVRGASLPQLKRPHAAFGDGFKLSVSNAAGAGLRTYGVLCLPETS